MKGFCFWDFFLCINFRDITNERVNFLFLFVFGLGTPIDWTTPNPRYTTHPHTPHIFITFFFNCIL
ncbi:uncharacterized protein DS421_9g284910 [Arachis hypogaea]|nr:uncharacterized protein DS421_9g284910 [Arachis hypogaea]